MLNYKEVNIITETLSFTKSDKYKFIIIHFTVNISHGQIKKKEYKCHTKNNSSHIIVY